MIYVVLLIVIFILKALIYRERTIIKISKDDLHLKTVDNLHLKIVFFLFFILMGFRDNSVGIDTINYYYIFQNSASATWSDLLGGYTNNHIEIFYSCLMKLVSSLGLGFDSFKIFTAFIYNVLMYRFIYHFSVNKFSSLCIYLGLGFLTTAFNIERQMLAISFLCNSFVNYDKKSYIKAGLFFILSGLTHTILFIVGSFAIWLYCNKNSNKIMLTSFVGVCVLLPSVKMVLEIASTYIPRFHTYYLGNQAHLTAGGVVIFWAMVILLSCIVIACCLLRDDIYDSPLLLYSSVMSYMYVITCVIGLDINYFERLGICVLPFMIVFFDRIGVNIKDYIYKNLYYASIVIFFVTWYLATSIFTTQYEYHFFIN